MSPSGQRLPSRSLYASNEWIGRRFGNRVVVALEGRNSHGYYRWRVRCDCGSEAIVQANHLVAGKHQRCLDCTNKAQTGSGSKAWKGFGAVSSTAYSFFKASADHRGIAWNITIEDIAGLYEKQGGRCALSGAPLRFRAGWQYKRFGNASLDRKDSSRGYEPDNIQLVTSDINFAKQQLSNDEFVELCRSVVVFHDEKFDQHQLNRSVSVDSSSTEAGAAHDA